MRTTNNELSPRERLLAAATELFYEEGVHTVGIDRIIEKAGVAKASLYASFGSKEELVRAYLEARSAARQERIARRIAHYDDPRDKILGIFDSLEERVVEPTFRGCAFVNAAAEEPRGPTKVRKVCADSRGWLRGLLFDLAREGGAADAERVARALTVLYDGAIIGASMDDDPKAPVTEARAMAESLLAETLGKREAQPKRAKGAAARATRAARR